MKVPYPPNCSECKNWEYREPIKLQKLVLFDFEIASERFQFVPIHAIFMNLVNLKTALNLSIFFIDCLS